MAWKDKATRNAYERARRQGPARESILKWHREYMSRYLIEHPEQREKALEQKRKRIRFLGKYIMLPKNPRMGKCSKCGMLGRTHIHHDLYDEANPLSHTRELCLGCHSLAHDKVGLMRGEIRRECMRSVAAGICLVVLALFVPQANAVGTVGICAVIRNQTKAGITVDVPLPTIYAQYSWTIPAGATELLTIDDGTSNGTLVTTTGQTDANNNLLYVHATGYAVDSSKSITFVYEPKRNVAAGCNGSFVGTVHGR